MGKIRTRTIGLEDVEEKQKKEQKEKAAAKKSAVAEPKADKGKKKSKALEELKEVEAKEKIETPEAKREERVERSERESTKSTSKKPKKVLGKKHRDAKKKVDAKKSYSVVEAVKILKSIKYANFDESVEVHVNVEEIGVKGEVELPHTTGKSVRIKIVDDAVIASLEKGVIDFDILITHPSFMPKLAKFARSLGPKGLMPNPKAGTISANPEETAKRLAGGMLKWKTEVKFPLIHQMIGKISHDEKALTENAQAFLQSVMKNKVKAAFIKTTMSPSVRLSVEA